MDVAKDDHTEWSKSDKKILYGITYMYNLNNGTDGLTYKTETDSDTENKLMVIKGEAGGGIN